MHDTSRARILLATWTVSIALWAGSSDAATTVPRTAVTDVPASAYEHAQTLIPLPDGRRLNLFCMGAGTPVVILEAGLGDDDLSFRRVQGRLADVTRVCSYDRAGMGFSDPSVGPSTAFHVANDLHALIRQASIPLPVVLVGHSNGGLYAALYAADFPREVAGLVLIDPDSFGLDEAARKVLDQPWLDQWRAGTRNEIGQARTCVALAQRGALNKTPARYPDCMDNPPNADPALHRLLDAQLARPSEQEAISTETQDTDPPPDRDLSDAELAFQRLHFDFGDKPIIVLSGTNELGGLPPSQRAKVTKAMLANEAAMAAYSTQGRQILVDSKSEYLQTYAPDVVVRAVTDVVRKVRVRMAAPQAGLEVHKN
ncbi:MULTISPECIES: alpha/beta hydrolase [Rhodanobacter]|uniref:Alpha/beta hydrolase n=1 Tax=Rhodanobacter hydrolyticus TaxID=2250595 RepID=A0ABW8J636_9GAMM|nr:alpha/beta hydrolase [Rhodanobacter sp. 7MK24]MBD8879855.1 alpha/beta hydrolase [Rhodanobacter sp. 7MK24]